MQNNIKMTIPGGLSKQSGFTLIELVMVIVILGILSAFAIPRFADLSGQAEISAMEGARASVKSSAAISHALALAESKTALSGESISLEGTTINLVYGYPEVSGLPADLDNGIAEAASVIDDFTVEYRDGADALSALAAAEKVIISNGDTICFTYVESASAGAAPLISGLLTYLSTATPPTCT